MASAPPAYPPGPPSGAYPGGPGGWQAPAPRRKSRVGLILGIVAVIVVLGLVFVGLVIAKVAKNEAQANKPLITPQAVGELTRIDNDQLTSLSNSLLAGAHKDNVKANIVVAGYAKNGEKTPEVILGVIRTASDPARRSFLTGAQRGLTSATSGAGSKEKFVHGGVGYQCSAGKSTGFELDLCTWNDGDTAGMVMTTARFESLSALSDLSDQARRLAKG